MPVPVNLSASDITATSVRLGWMRWTPLQIFLSGVLGVWFDPSDLSTLFQDAAGTIPVTADGDPVGLMLDKSGNGYHASQTGSGARPVYRTDGTLHWLKFDGIDDFLLTGVSVMSDQPYIMAAASSNSDGDQIGVVFNTDENKSTSLFLTSDTRGIKRIHRFEEGSSLILNRLEILTADEVEVISAYRLSNSVVTARKNSVVQSSGNRTTVGFGVSGLWLGKYGGGEFLSPISFYGGVIQSASEVTLDNAERVEAYLADLSGVTL